MTKYKLKYLFCMLLLFSGSTMAGHGSSLPDDKPKVIRATNGVPWAEDDFYGHVNQSWLDSISSIRSEEEFMQCNVNSIALKKYNALVDSCISKMVDEEGNNKVKAFYLSIMPDEGNADNDKDRRLEIQNTTKDILNEIDKYFAFNFTPLAAGGYLDKFGVNSIANIEIHPNTTSNIGHVYIVQSVIADLLGPPQEKLTLKDVQDTLNLLAVNTTPAVTISPKTANNILNLENKIHQQEYPFVALKEYNIDKLPKNWQEYLRETGISQHTRSVFINTFFYDTINDLPSDREVWKWYFKFRFAVAYKRILLSAQHNTEVNRSLAFEQIKVSFGNEINRLCFDGYLNANKGEIDQIFNNIKTAYLNGIEQSVWIKTPKTKQIITNRIANMRLAIGYPGYDYSGDSAYALIGSSNIIEPNHPLGNTLRINQQYYQYFVDKIGVKLPLSYVVWDQNNLYHNLSPAYLLYQNALLLPITELQQPFFDSSKDKSFNYGGIGSTIGHEISHASDVISLKEVSQITGKSVPFASQQEIDSLNALRSQLRTQYQNGGYTPAGSTDEDMADNRGLEKAYEAYLISLDGKPIPKLDNGMTGAQYLYYNYAKIWQFANYNECTSIHASAKTRTNAVLRNQPGFIKAYKVKAGDRMYVNPQIMTWQLNAP
ncbi:MAG: peptidase [Burkholderiales bacterium]|nr:peptidase [Burkholderiales bacterium]